MPESRFQSLARACIRAANEASVHSSDLARFALQSRSLLPNDVEAAIHDAAALLRATADRLDRISRVSASR